MQMLNEETFDTFASGPGVRVVVVGAENCRPSRRQIDEMEGLSGPARFAAIDALAHDDVRRRLNVRCLPTTLIFCDGLLHQTLQGYQPRARIETLISAVTRLASQTPFNVLSGGLAAA